jgi:hypothetical protein
VGKSFNEVDKILRNKTAHTDPELWAATGRKPLSDEDVKRLMKEAAQLDAYMAKHDPSLHSLPEGWLEECLGKLPEDFTEPEDDSDDEDGGSGPSKKPSSKKGSKTATKKRKQASQAAAQELQEGANEAGSGGSCSKKKSRRASKKPSSKKGSGNGSKQPQADTTKEDSQKSQKGAHEDGVEEGQAGGVGSTQFEDSSSKEGDNTKTPSKERLQAEALLAEVFIMPLLQG